MEPIKMNKPAINPIENANAVTPTQTPANEPDTLVNQTEGNGGVSESPKAEQSGEARKHSVIYLACGIWKDTKGQFWCRDKKPNCISSAVFTEEEFAGRPDIQYMVEYGAMKDVIVE